MHSNLVPFSFDSFSIRVVVIDGIPMFSARDVAVALEYTNPSEAYQDHCKSLKKLSYSELLELNWVTPNRQGEYLIPRSDVLRLITKSTKPEAERFEKWVFEEVLPAVLIKGSYSISSTPAPSIPLTLAQLQPEVTAALALAEMAGFTGNQLKLSADKAIKNRYNTSWLALVDASALPADPRGMTYTPTELGKSDEFKRQFGYTLSACKTNRFMAAFGLQSNQTGVWIPTDAAKGHYEWLDTGKRHTDGTPVKQLKWFISVLSKMNPFQNQEAA